MDIRKVQKRQLVEGGRSFNTCNYCTYLYEIFLIYQCKNQAKTSNETRLFAVKYIYFRIILPQVIKRILPSVTNEVITLVKDTSLAFTIGVLEMFTQAKALASSQTSMIPFVADGLFYYIFYLIVACTMEWMEKKLEYYR